MKHSYFTSLLSLSLILSSLAGCANPADSAGASGNSVLQQTDPSVTTETTEIQPSTTTEPSSTETQAPSTSILDEPPTEGGTLYYNNADDPKYAVLVKEDGNQTYYVKRSTKWVQIPERQYRNDLFWATVRNQDGYYTELSAGALEWSCSAVVLPGYVDKVNNVSASNFVNFFLNNQDVEIRYASVVNCYLTPYTSNNTGGDSIDYFSEDKEKRMEEQEAYLTSLGFEVLIDHKFARQNGVDIEEAVLVVIGTQHQFEEAQSYTFSENKETGEYEIMTYQFVAASYEHYAPSEYVEADASMILYD
jgi:hypothetical protein